MDLLPVEEPRLIWGGPEWRWFNGILLVACLVAWLVCYLSFAGQLGGAVTPDEEVGCGTAEAAAIFGLPMLYGGLVFLANCAFLPLGREGYRPLLVVCLLLIGIPVLLQVLS